MKAESESQTPQPDRFEAIALEEQRAVIDITDECLALQAKLPAIRPEPDRHPLRWALLWLALLVVVLAGAYLAWRYVL